MVARAMIFAEPAWFWALPTLCAAGFGLWKLSLRIATKRMGLFFSASLLPEILARVDWRQKLVRFALVAVILMLLAAALARPLTGPKNDRDERKGADLVIALDVSKSMWANDVPPSRLQAVKKELSEWIMGQKTDRIGLVLFAGKAFVQAPLTYDYTALDFVLRDAGPRSVSKKGSNIPEAIETASHMMNNNKLESKVLLIISDGENLEGDAIAAARAAHQNEHLTIYTVGVGTAAGAKVPTFDEKTEAGPPPNQTRYVRSEYGVEVVSRLDSQALRAIASVGGGVYYEFRPGESTFPTIRSQSISTLVEKMRKIKTRDYDEWFQIPLGLAILLMVLDPLICRTRRRSSSRETGVAVVNPVTYSRPGKRTPIHIAAAAGVLLLSAGAARSEVASSTAEADKLFTAGKAGEAVELLQQQVAANPTDPYLIYNYGLGLYRVGRWTEANAIFQSVEGLATDAKLRAQVFFQMGNIAYLTGMDLCRPGAHQNGVHAVRAFEQALSSYHAHLQIQANREATHNVAATAAELQDVLLAIGKERTRANTEKTLREALQAYERATELNKKHQPLVDEAKMRLSKELAKNAAAADVEADKAEAGLQTIPEGVFKGLFEKREQIAGRLEEAVGLTPGDGNLAAALKKQQEKMSALLTKAARDQSADAMKAERFFSNRNLKNLEEAGGKLDQALTLNPANKEAQDLNEQVKGKLVDAYVANGDLALGHLRKSMDAAKAESAESPVDKAKVAARLESAISASDAYSKALGLAPENEKARNGLEEVNRLLPELYSKAGKSDLEKAENQLGSNFPKPGESPDGKNTEGEAPQGSSDGMPSADALRNASATLEKAVQNLGAAAGLKPDDAGFQKDLSDAEKLMSAVRFELEKSQGIAAANAPGGEPAEGKEGASGEGEGGSGEGKGPGKPGAGKSSLKSMSSLRGKGGESGGSEGGESKRYWDKLVKDW